jgi:hypothetical protein
MFDGQADVFTPHPWSAPLVNVLSYLEEHLTVAKIIPISID